MAVIARVRVSLRVFGDTLEPEEVSALLGRDPTRCHRRGDPLGGDGGSAVERTGAWILDSSLDERTEIEEHIENLLSSVSNDSDEWEQLTSLYSASVMCSAFLDQYNEGFELSPRVLQSLSERGLVVAFDIYSGDVNA